VLVGFEQYEWLEQVQESQNLSSIDFKRTVTGGRLTVCLSGYVSTLSNKPSTGDGEGLPKGLGGSLESSSGSEDCFRSVEVPANGLDADLINILGGNKSELVPLRGVTGEDPTERLFLSRPFKLIILRFKLLNSISNGVSGFNVEKEKLKVQSSSCIFFEDC